MSTPSATPMLISARSLTGCESRIRNVPARMMPALVSTPPVAASAFTVPSRSPWRMRLAADARGDEDVVVAAQRHQEDEHVQRDAVADVLPAEELLGDDDGRAERRQVREHVGEQQVERRDQGAQQQRRGSRRPRPARRRRRRWCRGCSCAQVSAWVAVGPPTRAVPPPGGGRLARRRRAARAPAASASLRVGVALEDDLEAEQLAVVGACRWGRRRPRRGSC